MGRLRWCDYLLIPSRIESIPVILSDAIQLGTPVIATEVGDMPAVFEEMAIGDTVPPLDPAAFADMLLECVGRESSVSEFSKKSVHQKSVQKRFSV